ncbi:MAG: membrane integrity-associated transporter subunit PqiC [Deltaproteobacteria bacterium]|nr:membrane integrity-associated transporter subunit PqiC [Deltaproteobacteria bacterium]
MKNNIFVIMALCCMFTGCTGKSVPPADIYTISAQWEKSGTPAPEEKKNTIIIQLAPIRASIVFGTTAMLYSKAHYDQNSYAYSHWSDSPVRLLHVLFQAVLEESGRFGAVISPTSASEADFLIESTLYDFSHHINEDETSDGVVRIRFYLVNNTTKKVTETEEFVSRVPASTLNSRGAAVALNKASANVACGLTSWLAEPGRFDK